MGELFKLNEITDPKQFTLTEAQKILPLIRRITAEAAEEVKTLEERSRQLSQNESPTPFYSHRIQLTIQRWADKVRRLGAVPKGLWTVDFSNGNGFYCWKFPEEEVGFFHEYDQQYSDRLPIV